MVGVPKAVKVYQAALKRLLNTPDGHIVLATWKEDFVKTSSLVLADPHSTMYHLGQKEFVIELITHLKDDGVLDEVKLEIEE